MKSSTKPTSHVVEAPSDIVMVPTANLLTWRGNPRRTYDEEALQELADSIRAIGLQSALVVRPITCPEEVDSGRCYQVIAGSRRLIAARMASVDSVPFGEQLSREKITLKMSKYGGGHLLHAECNDCPLNACRSLQNWEWICLRPDHFHELTEEKKNQAEAQAAKSRAEVLARATNPKVLEVARAATCAPSVESPGDDTETELRREELQDTIEESGEEVGEVVAGQVAARVQATGEPLRALSFDDLVGDIESITLDRVPDGCSEACECRMVVMKGLKCVPVCIHGSRYRSLLQASQKQTARQRRDLFRELR